MLASKFAAVEVLLPPQLSMTRWKLRFTSGAMARASPQMKTIDLGFDNTRQTSAPWQYTQCHSTLVDGKSKIPFLLLPSLSQSQMMPLAVNKGTLLPNLVLHVDLLTLATRII